MEKVLVTGGAGFIGSHIVGGLLNNGYVVVAYDNLVTGRMKNVEEFNEDENFRFVKEDILDYKRLMEEVSGAKYLFHQAALPSVVRSISEPVNTNHINIDGTTNVLLAARAAGVEKVVIASSAAVYGDNKEQPTGEGIKYSPLSPYAVSKATNEMYAALFGRLYDLSTVCLRYFNVYGPKQDTKNEYAAVIPKFITAALQGRPLKIFGDGEQTRDFVFIDDVVKGNILSMKTKAEGNFNIGSGLKISINELAKKIVNIADSNSKIVHVEPRVGEILHSWADIDKVRREIRYEPSYSIDEGISRTVEWFRNKVIK